MKFFILAGGFATRLWPLTEKRAKPLLLLDGKTILAHILDKIPVSGEVFLLTNKAFEEDFRAEMKKCGRKNFQIFCEDAHSDQQKLGAVKAVSLAVKEFKIDENIFVFAGDNILPELSVERLQCEENEAGLAVREVETLDEARKFGVVEGEKKKEERREKIEGDLLSITGFEEKPEHPKSRLVSTGFLSIGRELLPILHQTAEKSPDGLGNIFVEFLSHGKKVFGVPTAGDWFDVGSFETYLEAHRALQKKDLSLGKKVFQKGNVFSGKVFLGDDCRIENCQITDSIVYPACRLKNCHISQSVIDGNCDLSGLDLSRKLVRRGTKINDQ